MVGATVGERLGSWATIVAAVLAWSRLRFRPSASACVWRRQAALQRRTAGLLQPLEQEGYLVLHDLTLPGWPASLQHLVVGPTGVWVVESWRRRRLLPGGGAPPATLRGLRGQTGAVAEGLDGPDRVPVRPLLCVHGRWPASTRSFPGGQAASPRQLAKLVRSGPPLAADQVQRATTRALQLLRPAT